MKLLTLIPFLAVQLRFIAAEHSHLLNSVKVIEFDEVTHEQCLTVPHLDSQTRFDIEVEGIQNQNLPVNVKFNSEPMSFDFANPKDRHELELSVETTTVYEGVFEENGKHIVNIYRPGNYCISFNNDSKFIGPFKAKATLIEEIFPITIQKEMTKAGIKSVVGILVLAGIAFKYNIMSVAAFKDLTPVCRGLMLVLFVEIAYFSTIFILELLCAAFPSGYAYLIVENYLKRGLHSVQECWKTYVIVMIYFGSGYKNLGYKVPSNIPMAGRVFLAVLLTFMLVILPNHSVKVAKRTVLIDGEVSDKYLMIYNNSPSPYKIVRGIMAGLRFVGSGLLLLCISVVPVVYGYIIYSRFAKSGEVENAELMKKTLLFHGIGYTITTIVAGDYEFVKLVTEYIPIVLLWWIWYSEKPHVALKNKYNDVEDTDSGIPLQPIRI
ncbi:hypothetical protein Cantr_01795 [Candida viswanathii]|uniref:Uncharacterized protein n=1 Tax=Candida viswanathii TaxID=5486 RepID=A0A367YM55_9ASCO|nr:hypothetical protein Cantr_01795 [Candida viswanathii]